MTVSFKTFGCRLNRAETVRFEQAFAEAGVATVPFGESSDIVVIHTCAVTQTAESECLRLARSLRRKNPGVFLVLSGCAAESAKPETLASLGMDLIVHRNGRDKLAATVLDRLAERGSVDLPETAAPPNGTKLHRALLKVQDGCSCFCTYCIVPHTRGVPRSRPFEACLEEAGRLLAEGFREIVVVGCNLAFYEDGGRTLPDLLRALTGLSGNGRIRLSSLEPGKCEREVVSLMAQEPRLCNFLHLPLQSGSDPVLKRMGRGYSVAELRRVLDTICEQVPMLGLGADFITGFPGETEAMFNETKQLIESYPFSNLHVFPYSERPGTPAAAFDGKVPPETRKRRAHELIELREQKKATFAKRHLGRTVDVLVERIQDGSASGWTEDYLECRFETTPPPRQGELVKAVPYAVDGTALLAKGV
ncbi:MAG: MiaB/RimO family radical SAM methylthiotransferase [Kiritimatiellae bacterium]|nr:MiaB/RimO family radical SAM methylthiotransferase [Kiritimatiellia bacterium]